MKVKEIAKNLEQKYNVEFISFDEADKLKEEISIIKDHLDHLDKLIATLDKVLENLTKVSNYLEV